LKGLWHWEPASIKHLFYYTVSFSQLVGFQSDS
jgi:hypothetical protein